MDVDGCEEIGLGICTITYGVCIMMYCFDGVTLSDNVPVNVLEDSVVDYCFFASLSAFLNARRRMSSCIPRFTFTTMFERSPRNLERNHCISP